MNIRKITSLTMFLSFSLCILTSIILYIVPQGRVAYWADWHLWGMTKSQWGDIHVNLGFLMLFAGLLHVFYNWKVITAYMKNRSRKIKVFTGSFNVALLLCLVVGLGTFYQIPPVYTVISFSESIKDTAAKKYGEPPYGHAELSSLKSFTKKVDIDLEGAKKLLENAGISFTGDQQSIADIAAANRMTPKAVHAVMESAQIKVEGGATFPKEAFPGFGRKVLADICNEFGMDTHVILKQLAEENINAEASQTIKEIAASADMDPHAFFEVLHRVATK
jgi:hypothetical protein